MSRARLIRLPFFKLFKDAFFSRIARNLCRHSGGNNFLFSILFVSIVLCVALFCRTINESMQNTLLFKLHQYNARINFNLNLNRLNGAVRLSTPHSMRGVKAKRARAQIEYRERDQKMMKSHAFCTQCLHTERDNLQLKQIEWMHESLCLMRSNECRLLIVRNWCAHATIHSRQTNHCLTIITTATAK